MSFERPYEGIKVVDLSQGIAGPYCGMLLAQHGADVIKVEPLDGDWARLLGTQVNNHTEFSFIGSLGKRSLAIDLKNEEAHEIIDALVAEADVFMEGFRPGVIERLGYGHERLMALNPRLIYLSVSGFSQAGPLRDKPAMDPVLQAFTGFMADNTGEDGMPHRCPTIVVDMATALFNFQCLAPALHAQRDYDRGRYIDNSLMQSAANLSAIRIAMASNRPTLRNAGAPPGGVYETANGWLQLAVIKDVDFHTVCDIVGLGHLKDDDGLLGLPARQARAEELAPLFIEVMRTKTAREWRDIFTEAGLQNEMLQEFQEFLAHPQVEATELFTFFDIAGLEHPLAIPNPPGPPKLQPGTPAGSSPVTGQHTDEVLAGLGHCTDAIAGLRKRGVVTSWTPAA